MRIIETGLPGLLLIEPKVFGDSRGFFLETWSRTAFAALGLDYDFVQDNHARSAPAGVLRGLHFQRPPAAQAKLVRVTRGAVFDVAVDLRTGSPGFGKWYGAILSADNFRQMLIPRGFAHGYLTLAPDTEFLYKVDSPYAPDLDAGLAWDDPDLAVAWPLAEHGIAAPILSDKDRNLPGLAGFASPFTFAPPGR
ncbi:MAG: dTDP-4-dehydrorhamnose 3,5-epimerase [Thermodesulfobacteriota bacterium]